MTHLPQLVKNLSLQNQQMAENDEIDLLIIHQIYENPLPEPKLMGGEYQMKVVLKIYFLQEIKETPMKMGVFDFWAYATRTQKDTNCG